MGVHAPQSMVISSYVGFDPSPIGSLHQLLGWWQRRRWLQAWDWVHHLHGRCDSPIWEPRRVIHLPRHCCWHCEVQRADEPVELVRERLQVIQRCRWLRPVDHHNDQPDHVELIRFIGRVSLHRWLWEWRCRGFGRCLLGGAQHVFHQNERWHRNPIHLADEPRADSGSSCWLFRIVSHHHSRTSVSKDKFWSQRHAHLWPAPELLRYHEILGVRTKWAKPWRLTAGLSLCRACACSDLMGSESWSLAVLTFAYCVSNYMIFMCNSCEQRASNAEGVGSTPVEWHELHWGFASHQSSTMCGFTEKNGRCI